jgi:hypothetical protein
MITLMFENNYRDNILNIFNILVNLDLAIAKERLHTQM